MTDLYESVSYESTVTTIVSDVGTILNEVYASLLHTLERYYSDHGDLKNFPIIAGGVTGKWIGTVYKDSLVHNLWALCKYRPQQTAALKEFLRGTVEEKKFKQIEGDLPYILLALSKSLNLPRLHDVAVKWDISIKKFYKRLNEIKEEIKAAEYEPTVDNAPKHSSNVGQQNAQVELIINDVLKRVPSKDAADIRRTIARADNKLQALQLELQKRNIQVNESAFKRYSFDLDSAMAELDFIMENKMSHGARQSFCGLQTWASLDNNNSPYHAYRFGLAMAAAPDHHMDKDGPVGGKFVTLGYTDADDEIVKHAAKSIGVKATKESSKKSVEVSDVNNTSPVAKIKRNRYGV